MICARRPGPFLRLVAASAALVVLGALAVDIGAAQSASAAHPAGFTEVTAFRGLVNPTAVRFAPDGRVFVAEKRGTIEMFDSLSDTTPTRIADLRTEVYNFWDRGLLGLAVDPGFPARPYLYALYTYDGAINETAPKWGTPGTDSDPCPNPPGATSSGCVASSKLVRLTLNSNDTTTKLDLIHDWCQQFPSHSVGSLTFGQDGALYVSHGEGASFNYADYGQTGNPCGDPPGRAMTPPRAEGGSLRAQDLRTPKDPVSLDGSVIRVDPDTGAAMPDNPNAGASDPNARRIVAYGLRNPFRATMRPGTGELWIGDVGSNHWEEANRLVNPKAAVTNFGWPCYEGNGRNAPFDAAGLNMCKNLYARPTAVAKPFFTYAHGRPLNRSDTCTTRNGSSITGVAFQPETGSSYPAAYNGALFFADYSRNCIWVMTKDAGGLPDPATVTPFVSAAAGPTDLVISPQGELFYADVQGGTIRRIVYGTDATTCRPGQYRADYFANVTLTGPAASRVCEASPLKHDWGTATPVGVGPHNFSARWTGSFRFARAATYTFTAVADDGVRVWVDGTLLIDRWQNQPTSTTFTAPRYLAAGTHQVTMEWYNASGSPVAHLNWAATGTDVPPQPRIDTPAVGSTWKVGDRISFSGSATDAEHGTLPASALRWEMDIEHCPSGAGCHIHILQTFPGVKGGSVDAPDHSYPSYLLLRLTATDSVGQSTTVTRRLDPRTVPLTVDSQPRGLQLTLGDTTAATPFTRSVIVGSTTSLSAASPQNLSGASYTFTRWSDGGIQTHNVTAGSAAASVSATYTPTACAVGRYLSRYFANRTLSGTPVKTSCEAAPLNHNWGKKGPVGTHTDNFSARWSGTFRFPAGNRTFTATSDDGIRVWLDNTQIINRWGGPGRSRSTRKVRAGTHTVRIDYYERTGLANVKVTW